jgi:hypothetical protein
VEEEEKKEGEEETQEWGKREKEKKENEEKKMGEEEEKLEHVFSAPVVIKALPWRGQTLTSRGFEQCSFHGGSHFLCYPSWLEGLQWCYIMHTALQNISKLEQIYFINYFLVVCLPGKTMTEISNGTEFSFDSDQQDLKESHIFLNIF